MNLKKILPLAVFSVFSLPLNAAEINNDTSANNEYLWLKIFSEIYKIAKDEYVEPLTPKELLIKASKGMLEKLDPYSEYFTREELKEFEEDTTGEFGGIGIEISQKNGRPIVVAPIEGTPAYKAGLRAGDIIVKVNGEDTYGKSLSDIVKMIRGKPGTKVKLTIYRPSTDKTFTVEIERAIIRINPVKWTIIHTQNGEDIGYIKLIQFQPNIAYELKKALKEILKDKKLIGIIIDLRNNPGGLLDQAVAVADIFLPPNKVVVEIKGRHEHEVLKTQHPALIPNNMKLVILVNKGTASASEIVSGALQDYHRAILVGEKTFGKFRVQTLIPIENGKYGAVKITTAFYYTPKGRMLDKKGITPDILVNMTEEDWEKLYNATREMRIKENIGFNQVILLPKLDKQLEKAIEILKNYTFNSSMTHPKVFHSNSF
jgi:carboxyl-terminal processing protease